MINPDTWLAPLPLPDVIHTDAPRLPDPSPASAGRCFCCGATRLHRFLLETSRPLSQMAEKATDVRLRLAQVSEKQTPGAEENAAHLAARRMALRHILPSALTNSTRLSSAECAALPDGGVPPFALCAICHAWHALNGFAAAQGAMVWLPDLHPASVVALNRQALLATVSGVSTRQREGKKILSMLMQNRVAVEEKYRSWRPVDFAEVLRRHPPAQRDALRQNMQGLALILTPDSFPDPDVLT